LGRSAVVILWNAITPCEKKGKSTPVAGPIGIGMSRKKEKV